MNPPPIQWLPVYASAAKHKSFRKAAEELHVSPPAISQQIKALEEYLGISLFKRKGPRLDLTDAGEFYLSSIREMMKSYELGFEEFDRRFNKRSLRLNAPLFIAQEILIPNYMGYKQLEPNAELRITTGTEYINFESNVADAAIRFGIGEWTGLNSRKIGKVKIAPVCSSDYFNDKLSPQRNMTHVDTFDLVNNQVLLSTDDNLLGWRSMFPDIEPKDVIVCDSYFSVIKSAEMGLGIALGLFPAVSAWVNDQKLKLIGGELFDTDAAYWFVYPKQRAENQLMDSCYKWAKELFDRLPEVYSSNTKGT